MAGKNGESTPGKAGDKLNLAEHQLPKGQLLGKGNRPALLGLALSKKPKGNDPEKLFWAVHLPKPHFQGLVWNETANPNNMDTDEGKRKGAPLLLENPKCVTDKTWRTFGRFLFGKKRSVGASWRDQKKTNNSSRVDLQIWRPQLGATQNGLPCGW